jgi:cellulose synthase/poly-beta-1,6-N-acetylglucosamine synthase-like glycosyltransferase
MADIEIPLGKRTRLYRFFEIVPALCSYGAIILLIVLALINPLFAAMYLLLIIMTMLVKSVGIAYHTIRGRSNSERAQKVDWHVRLQELEDPGVSYEKRSGQLEAAPTNEFGERAHVENLRLMAAAPDEYPRPSEVYNAVIIAAYNEGYDVLGPTLESVLATSYDKQRLVIALAYEERGGPEMKKTALRLQREFGDKFFAFHIVEHPDGLPNEVVGKGGNITHAGKFLAQWMPTVGIEYKDVIVTTLDSDNRPHKGYFDYVTYEYIVHEDRKHLSYQPISLFLNNIWDAPAPMRVVATGNSFWNIISSMRPHTLRNFASHSQPMDALVEMDFWSTRTIVEDGHQYWRSYFYFNGNYSVTPIFVPIYQDAVMSNTYIKTLKAQFVQLRRWAYGASDVPYVASHLFTRKRNVPFFEGFARFIRLLDGHITLATVAILVAFGGWVPLLINTEAARIDPIVHQLPDTIGWIQKVAMIGLFITVFLSFKMLPPRPERYRRHRSIFMILQWVLMPVTAVAYNAAAALYSQARLASGRYLDKFDVTEKATAHSVSREKQQRQQKKHAKSKKPTNK